MSRLRTSPERRLDDDQQAALRKEMHRLVDQITDALPVIQRQEREWGRGFPSSTTGGGGGGGGDSSSTERAALNPHDPAAACAEWRILFDEALGHLRNAAYRATRLLPLTEAEIKQAQTRQNSVELCAECERPVVKGKRLDGALLHTDSPGTDEHGEPLAVCWWSAYNRTRGRRGSTEEAS